MKTSRKFKRAVASALKPKRGASFGERLSQADLEKKIEAGTDRIDETLVRAMTKPKRKAARVAPAPHDPIVGQTGASLDAGAGAVEEILRRNPAPACGHPDCGPDSHPPLPPKAPPVSQGHTTACYEHDTTADCKDCGCWCHVRSPAKPPAGVAPVCRGCGRAGHERDDCPRNPLPAAPAEGASFEAWFNGPQSRTLYDGPRDFASHAWTAGRAPLLALLREAVQALAFDPREKALLARIREVLK